MADTARHAIVAGTERITYGGLQRLTNRIGAALRARGVQRGDRVAMRFLNNIPFAATWLAVQKIGAIGVSTMPMLRARELAYIANDSEAGVFVCQSDLIDELKRAGSSFDHHLAIGAAEELIAADPIG
jgi:2-aminobenzoate-CoA ligase